MAATMKLIQPMTIWWLRNGGCGRLKGGLTVAEYYLHEIAAWNQGTDNLTLEQEAAYHRVVSMIRLYERPLKHNLRVLGGLWRCNERKAKRLLDELVAAGKVQIVSGEIVNEKAVEDASNLRQLRVERKSAGRRGGIESGKSRRKYLESNETGEASASTREEKAREEKSSVGKPTAADAPPDPVKVMFDSGIFLLGRAGIPEPKARSLIGKWLKAHGTETVIAALGTAQRQGAIDPVAFVEGVFRFKPKAQSPADDCPDNGDEKLGPTGVLLKFSGMHQRWMKADDWESWA